MNNNFFEDIKTVSWPKELNRETATVEEKNAFYDKIEKERWHNKNTLYIMTELPIQGMVVKHDKKTIVIFTVGILKNNLKQEQKNELEELMKDLVDAYSVEIKVIYIE